MTASWDLVVAGGGPAGAATATLAAQRGLRVCLIERARFPRDKVCGEFVSAEGCVVLRRLGVLPTLLSRGARWIRSCRLSDGAGRVVEAPLPELAGGGREALAVSRSLLDSVLLERALAAGAELRERHEVVAGLSANDCLAGVIARPVGAGGGGSPLLGRVVVAADGRRSVLGRGVPGWSGDPQHTVPSSWFGMKIHLSSHEDRRDDVVELHSFEGGYAGLLAVEQGRINVCLVARVAALRSCGGDPGRLFAERVLCYETVRARLPGARPCGRWLAVGPLGWGARRPAAAGALFVGDAAGTIDPFTGEGISHALRGAEIVQHYVDRALADGAVTAAVERSYRRAWRAEFAAATRRARAAGWLLERRRLAAPALRLLAAGPRSWMPWLVSRSRTGHRA